MTVRDSIPSEILVDSTHDEVYSAVLVNDSSTQNDASTLSVPGNSKDLMLFGGEGYVAASGGVCVLSERN